MLSAERRSPIGGGLQAPRATASSFSASRQPPQGHRHRFNSNKGKRRPLAASSSSGRLVSNPWRSVAGAPATRLRRRRRSEGGGGRGRRRGARKGEICEQMGKTLDNPAHRDNNQGLSICSGLSHLSVAVELKSEDRHCLWWTPCIISSGRATVSV